MEFGSNTTEKFENSLKNLKTHEAQHYVIYEQPLTARAHCADPDNQESRRKRSIEEVLLKVPASIFFKTKCFVLSLTHQAKLDNLTQDFKLGRGSREKLQR